MGIYSTMEISREEALIYIERELKSMDVKTNEELAEVLFALVGDKWGANFTITGEPDES